MKETHYKLKHRVTALFAATVMLCSMPVSYTHLHRCGALAQQCVQGQWN